MSPPIYTPDGSEVTEIVLPDGSTASEVVAPDGSVVFEAGPDIPDSVVSLFDAREITGLNSGDVVDPFPAQVGNDYPAVGAPTYQPSVINGQAGVNYDGGDDGHSGTSITVSQPYTLYIVLNPDFGDSKTENQTVAGSGSNTVVHQWGSGSWRMFAGSTLVGSSTASRQILSFKADGANSLIREDATQTASGDAGTASFDLTSLGYWAEGGSRYFDGQIGYAELHDQVPSAGVSGREQEIINDWGLSV